MASQQPDQVASKMSADLVVHAGCLLAFMALWWPFASFCIVGYSIFVAELKEPFVNQPFVLQSPTWMAMFAPFGLLSRLFSRDEIDNFRLIPRNVLKCLRVLAPWLLAITVLNVLCVYWLEAVWEWKSPYGHPLILPWSLLVSVVSTACTYFAWRLLLSPILNPKQAEPTK
jgi:hypothetical protein